MNSPEVNPSLDYEKTLIQSFKDLDFAILLLNSILDEMNEESVNETQVKFLRALELFLKSNRKENRGKKPALSKTTLYEIFNGKKQRDTTSGNPRLKNFFILLQALQLKIRIQKDDSLEESHE